VQDDAAEDGEFSAASEVASFGPNDAAAEVPQHHGQMTLFGAFTPAPAGRIDYPAILPLPRIACVSADELRRAGIGSILAGLGFEERTETAFLRSVEASGADATALVQYQEPGRTKAIRRIADQRKLQKTVVKYDQFDEAWLPPPGPVLVDVTGLAKPIIFNAVRSELLRKRKVYVAYTAAEQYYPREDDIAKVLDAEKGDDHHRLLEALRDILTGEEGPYTRRPLLPHSADETRGRGLCAFSSAKQERLLNLLDGRDYDAVDILVNEADRPRSRVARIAAEVANQDNRNTSVTVCPSEDAAALLAALGVRYQDWYVKRGLNFEVGLTGNKMQAVAAAALSATVKVNQCWYISPSVFDADRFTTGVGSTKFLRISVDE
jgi:hypothetical protein